MHSLADGGINCLIMSDKQSAISVDLDLTKPITVFVEKIASAAGILYEPTRIKKKAKAEGEATIILAKAQIKANSLEVRAVNRLLQEETRKQANIESVLDKTIPQVSEGAKPDQLDDDWVANFFEKSKNISDTEMQDVWSRLLAGEANQPGSYSKRTVNLLAELDKSDAILFTKLANFTIVIHGSGIFPYVKNVQDKIYTNNGVNFSNLQHLDALGLVKFSNLSGFKTYRANQKGGNFLVLYQGKPLLVTIPDDRDSEIETGHVMYTQQGHELFQICSTQSVSGFTQYLISSIEEVGLSIKELNTQ